MSASFSISKYQALSSIWMKIHDCHFKVCHLNALTVANECTAILCLLGETFSAGKAGRPVDRRHTVAFSQSPHVIFVL